VKRKPRPVGRGFAFQLQRTIRNIAKQFDPGRGLTGYSQASARLTDIRLRRLRMSLASSSPGASGDTARPNYVGPSGNGLVGADERG
jgi:hypothetical protein